MSVEPREQPIRREHDSMDDFEHLEHVHNNQSSCPEASRDVETDEINDETFDNQQDAMDTHPIGQPLFEDSEDPRKASSLFLEAEKTGPIEEPDFEVRSSNLESDSLVETIEDQLQHRSIEPTIWDKQEIQNEEEVEEVKEGNKVEERIFDEPKVPQMPPTDLASNVPARSKLDDSWNIVENFQPTATSVTKDEKPEKKEDASNEYVFADAPKKGRNSATEVSKSQIELDTTASAAKTFKPAQQEPLRKKVEDIEIAPKEIFRNMGIDTWFNPERLNPKVAALIYWRDPKTSGAVFVAILGVLLSLAYCSLISVIAYVSLIILTGTCAFRIYKSVLQAVQKTSDGHPFKEILELDLTLPTEKVHEVADVAVAHANAAVSELRRLFLVEDFVDTLKFICFLWSMTYVGSIFNGMTLIIIGVVALFTLPKVYETNKAQIDQNLALVHGKINELTAKVKAAVPLGKKAEPAKEE